MQTLHFASSVIAIDPPYAWSNGRRFGGTLKLLCWADIVDMSASVLLAIWPTGI